MGPKSFRRFLEVLEDIYQFYDVQRQFGQQDQQAPIIEEVKEFGKIVTRSLLDHEMAKMSPVEKMSNHQSQMHQWLLKTRYLKDLSSVQYSLFTSAERTSSAWLKGQHGSRIALSTFLRLKNLSGVR